METRQKIDCYGGTICCFTVISVICVSHVLLFGTISIIFSALPDTRAINIGKYNNQVSIWNIVQQNITNYGVSAELNQNKYYLSKNNEIDHIIDKRPNDNFTSYKHHKWSDNGLNLAKGIKFDTTHISTINLTIFDNGTFYTRHIKFYTFDTTTYCCYMLKGSCYRHCTNYEVVNRMCIVFDYLKKDIFVDNGCVSNGIKYGIIQYGQYDFSGVVNMDIMIREKNDPHYNIPFIIGFGLGNIWGVSSLDNLIVYSIFWSLTAITLHCSLISGLIICAFSCGVIREYNYSHINA